MDEFEREYAFERAQRRGPAGSGTQLTEDLGTRVALIVEDDPGLQKVMTAHLGRMRFDVAGAFHYAAAADHLAARRPHIVCVALELPTQSGYELCEYIRGPLGFTHVPILVTSHSASARDMASAEEAGANALLKKPFTMRQLTRYVEALLGEAHRSEPFMRRLHL
jgi:two-component system phosphate regulon response regulator PhoB